MTGNDFFYVYIGMGAFLAGLMIYAMPPKGNLFKNLIDIAMRIALWMPMMIIAAHKAKKAFAQVGELQKEMKQMAIKLKAAEDVAEAFEKARSTEEVNDLKEEIKEQRKQDLMDEGIEEEEAQEKAEQSVENIERSAESAQKMAAQAKGFVDCMIHDGGYVGNDVSHTVQEIMQEYFDREYYTKDLEGEAFKDFYRRAMTKFSMVSMVDQMIESEIESDELIEELKEIALKTDDADKFQDAIRRAALEEAKAN